MSRETKFIPSTPAGSVLVNLESKTEAEAWRKLLEEASHMAYRNIQDLKNRGYTVDEWREDV